MSMAFHPPLYYIIGSLFFKNDRGLLEEQIDINDGPGFNRIIPPQNREAPHILENFVPHTC